MITKPKIKLVYYKREEGEDEEKISLSECLELAEKYGIERDYALKLLKDPQIGEVEIEGLRLWSEEA